MSTAQGKLVDPALANPALVGPAHYAELKRLRDFFIQTYGLAQLEADYKMVLGKMGRRHGKHKL